MKCAQFLQAWMEQWDGEPGRIASGVSVELAAHLDGCPNCEREIRALTRLREALQQDAEPQAPPNLASRALAQCVMVPATTQRRHRYAGWFPCMALAGLAVVGVFALARMPQLGVKATPEPPIQRVEAFLSPTQAREMRALATLGRAAERAERARLRAANALGRATRWAMRN